MPLLAPLDSTKLAGVNVAVPDSRLVTSVNVVAALTGALLPSASFTVRVKSVLVAPATTVEGPDSVMLAAAAGLTSKALDFPVVAPEAALEKAAG